MRWLMVVCVVVIGLFVIGLGEVTRQVRSEVAKLRWDQKLMKEEQKLIRDQQKSIREESIDCIVRSLETLEEAREMINSVFAERIFIPVSKDVLIAIDAEGGEEEEGMLVEIQDE